MSREIVTIDVDLASGGFVRVHACEDPKLQRYDDPNLTPTALVVTVVQRASFASGHLALSEARALMAALGRAVDIAEREGHR